MDDPPPPVLATEKHGFGVAGGIGAVFRGFEKGGSVLRTLQGHHDTPYGEERGHETGWTDTTKKEI